MLVEMTEARVAAAAARLHGGSWWFSPRQLYYAACAEVEVAPVRVAPGEVGLGVLLILVGLIVTQRVVLLVLGGLGLLLVLLGAVTHLQERRRPSQVRALAMSFAEFERRFLGGDTRWDGLISAMHAEPDDTGGPLVVCDRPDTAAVVAANSARLGSAIAIVTAAAVGTDLRGRRVVLLHDCDPAGCALPLDLRERGADVVDAGIRPAEVMGRRAQVIEGAPARLPRDLGGDLSADEVDWLRSGSRLECATETPEQLVQRVRAAL